MKTTLPTQPKITTPKQWLAGRSQLVVQHFMFGPGWEEGCKSCSFMLDHFNTAAVHLPARDVAALSK